MKYIIVIFLFVLYPFIGNSQVINAGIGGNNTKDLLRRINKDVISQKPDLTILMVGTNDMLNSRKMTTYALYTERLTEIVKDIKSTGSKLILMSPPPVDSAYLFLRHDRKLYTQAPNEMMDSVSKIMHKVAKENGVYFFNLYKEFVKIGVPDHGKDMFIRNPLNSGAKGGVHPTDLGYHFIAYNLYCYLKKNHLLQKGIKIICFGDSITYGSCSKGGGTITGNNYPSYLNEKIN